MLPVPAAVFVPKANSSFGKRCLHRSHPDSRGRRKRLNHVASPAGKILMLIYCYSFRRDLMRDHMLFSIMHLLKEMGAGCI